MEIVVVSRFGGPEVLEIRQEPDPVPGAGQVRVRLCSVGINHADLMARRGAYKLYSGEPPFTPGLEGAGIVDAVGEGVGGEWLGAAVVLDARAPRRAMRGERPVEGTYRTHYVVSLDRLLRLPPAIPMLVAGTLWLSHLTAWGCLVWRQGLDRGQVVGISAASSSVGLAASQVARALGARTIGLTRRPDKARLLGAVPEGAFDGIVTTHDDEGAVRSWYRDVLRLTDGHGVDVFFDAVAAGSYLDNEIRCLAQGGTIWIYGLLGEVGAVDVTPLIRKRGAIRGWVLSELLEDEAGVQRGQREVLEAVAKGVYRQRVAAVFGLREIQQAHEMMERGEHIGKFVLTPSSCEATEASEIVREGR